MSRSLPAFVVVLAGALLAVAPAQDKPPPKKLALLVGVNQYEKPGFSKLDYAEQDVTELKTVLEAAGYEVKLLVGSGTGADRATRANVEAALKEWIGRATVDTTLVVALTGHGQELDGKPYFCPVDALDRKPESLVPLAAVIEAAELHAGSRLILVDACRNDPDPARGRGINRNVVRLKSGTAMFLACSSMEQAYEHPELKHGVFFYYVLQGLSGKLPDAKNAQGDVTISRLATAVEEAFAGEGKKWLPKDAKQTPQTPNFAAGTVLVSARDLGSLGQPKPGEERDVEIAAGVKMRFCWVPAGECQLGSPKAERDAVLKELIDAKLVTDGKEPEWLASEAEETRGKFRTKGFWLGKYEVTQAEWKAVMGGKNPSWFAATGGGKDAVKGLDTSRFPVESVSWDDCQEFLKAANAQVRGKPGRFRLPHEDEWEYAYRGGRGNGRAFYWGDALNGTEANCDGDYPFGTTTKGPYLKQPCAVEDTGGGKYERHPWGLMHMSGNIWEWCNNLYSSDRRVLRGGSWNDGAWGCRAANRSRSSPDYRLGNGGFRVCLPLD